MRTDAAVGALWFVCLIGGLAAWSSVRADPVIYSQPSDFPGGTVHASQNDTSFGGFGRFAVAYDDFTLANNELVTDVHWQGGYFNPPARDTITAFNVAFSSDNGGEPGVSLLAQKIAGNANETLVGSQPELGILVFDYSVVLPAPFQTAAGTRYWLSIVPDLPFPPQWGWHTGTAGNGVSFQDFLGEGTALLNDFAFELTGTIAVPEPAPLALLGLAVAALAARRRRQG